MTDIIDPRYQKGKIYKIVGSGMRYYGSTIKTLNVRLQIHEAHYKQWLEGKTHYCKSFDIIAKGNYKIVLVRDYPCSNRPELERKEGRYILKNECINKVVVGRTRKEYYEHNREDILENVKAYQETKREKIQEYKKTYYKTNKEKLNESISCHCGRTYTRHHKLRHERSQRHQSNV